MAKTIYKIRSYKNKDKKIIRKICANTGFLGNPIDQIFSDRELFADIITGYYLKKEPDHTFVAEANGKIIGYLTGSINRFAYLELALNGIMPLFKTVYRQLIGTYKNHPQNKEFLRWLFIRAPFEMPRHPTNAVHAHFNLKKGYRSQGIGTKLIQTMLKTLASELQKRKITTLYGEVFACSKKPEEYFREAGFEIFDKKRTTFFKNCISKEVYLLCITKKIEIKDYVISTLKRIKD